MLIDHLDRFRGCVLGGAVGDALATPLDAPDASDDDPFATRDLLEEVEPVREFLPSLPLGLRSGQWSGVTQVARLAMESAADRGRVDVEDLARRLVAVPREARRAWDGPLRRACQRLAEGTPAARSGGGDDVSGDAVPRSVGLALLSSLRDTSLDAVFYECRGLMRMTHMDSRIATAAFVLCAALSHGVSDSIQDVPSYCAFLEEQARFAEEKALPVDDPLSARIARIPELLGRPVIEVVAEAGNSADVLESLPFALWCLLKHRDDFESAVVEAANAGGAASLNAFLTGSLSGALLGRQAIPDRYSTRVEDGEHLLALAERLHARATEASP